MKKDNDRIDENSINDLIQYAEEESNTQVEETSQEVYEEPVEEQVEELVKEETIDNSYQQYTDEETDELTQEDEVESYYVEDYIDDEELVFEENKSSKKGIVLGIIIGLIVVIVFVVTDSGIIGNYKSNFSSNVSNVFKNFKSDENQLPDQTESPKEQYNTEIVSNTIVSFDEANDTEFVTYRNGILCAKMNYLSFIDETGAVVWEIKTAVVEPILKAEGNYILLAEKGRNKICLYSDSNLIYDVDDPDSILTADLSSNGDVVVVTNKSLYKGGISVYNKTGNLIFSWASGSDTVISADISAASRRVAVALLNTDSTAKTVVQLFDVNETESYSKVNIENTVVYDIKFIGDTINAFGDNRITGISIGGKIIYDNVFSDEQLTHSVMDKKGNKLLSFDDGNIPMINRYNKNGSLKDSITLLGVADFIDISEKDVIYNIGRDVYFGRIGTKVTSKYTSTMDIKKLLIISDNTFVIVYSNSLEFVTI